MSDKTNQSAVQPQGRAEGRSRFAVAIIMSLLVFGIVFVALWAFTTLSLVYALATATPTTVIVACSVFMIDAVGDCFSAIVDALASVFTAIVESIGAVIAAVLAALAAVFSIFGG